MYIFQYNHLYMYIINSIILIHYYDTNELNFIDDTDRCDVYWSIHVFTFGLRYIIYHVCI